MTRAAARFTQADVTRLVRGARKAGVAVDRVKVLADGSIMTLPPGANDDDTPESLLKAWQEKQGADRA